jgi:hypothetical protein
MLQNSVVCVSDTADLSIVHRIHSYRTRNYQTPCTILEAACACVASPDAFLPVNVGLGHRQITLVDGLALAANPGKELLREAQRAFGDDAEVATILSVGAGKGDVWSSASTTSSSEMMEAMKRATMTCEPVHEELYLRLRQTSIYFRLNVDRGSGPQIQLSSSTISAYLEEGVVSDKLDDVIKSIHLRPTGVKLSDISEYASMLNYNAQLGRFSGGD